MNCILDSLCWIPKPWLSPHDYAQLQKKLLIKPTWFDRRKPQPAPIESWVDCPQRNAVGVPIRWGLDWLAAKGLMSYATWETYDGMPIEPRQLPDPYHPLATKGQDRFIGGMLQLGEQHGVFCVKAGTGCGKTPCALSFIGQKKRTALVVVKTKTLASQWRKDIEKFLGFRPEEIGSIEEGKADWIGKAVVVAVVHNLVQKEWPPEMYGYFGTLVCDEVDALASNYFWQVLCKFATRYRFGMSATYKDKNGCLRLITNYFGRPCLEMASDAIACDCWVYEYRPEGLYLPPDIDDGILINRVAENVARNELLAGIGWGLYQKGRTTLGVSARVEQLEWFRARFHHAGVPESQTALYTRSYNHMGKEKVFKQTQLDAVKRRVLNREIKFLFATYGMMERGEDMPPLDAGFDGTPLASGAQAIGRIRRPMIDKTRPEWHTIADRWHPVLSRRTDARLKDYRDNNVTIHTYGQNTLH